VFDRNSRYANETTYTLRTSSGHTVTATRLPIRDAPVARGVHPRREDQRLDQIADHYLADATAFWRLCDVNATICPDALGARADVLIPGKGG
jgi:hypothetical protein